jgi:formate hydrogenlyase subunit 4
MRRIGAILMAVGVLVGCAMGVVVYAGAPRQWGLDWIIWIGLVKVGLATSIGFLGTGAAFQRLAHSREARMLDASTLPTSDETDHPPAHIRR